MADRSIFEVLGPIMIGPSSSHTAGAARLGRAARQICGKKFDAVHFLLHGSFAKTYRGHGTDKALAAGVLGMMPYDENLKDALSIAQRHGIALSFEPTDLGECHENTARMIFSLTDGGTFYVQGSSVGGGSIMITDIDGFETEITGEYPTIVIGHTDKPGVISEVTTALAAVGINIGVMRVKRRERGMQASMTIETDEKIPAEVIEELMKVENVGTVRVLNPIE